MLSRKFGRIRIHEGAHLTHADEQGLCVDSLPPKLFLALRVDLIDIGPAAILRFGGRAALRIGERLASAFVV
jgi:hypothetical protein